MATWTELDKINYLTAEQMNDIYNNFLYIKIVLTALGYSVEVKDCTVTQNINPKLIQAKFQNVEDNIKAVNNIITWQNYHEYYVWEAYNPHMKDQVYSWFDWFDNIKYIIDLMEAGYTPLTDINDEIITDIYDEVIYTK